MNKLLRIFGSREARLLFIINAAERSRLPLFGSREARLLFYTGAINALYQIEPAALSGYNNGLYIMRNH